MSAPPESPPSFAEVVAATQVDPEKASRLRLADRATSGEAIFVEKANALASLEADGLAIDELQDALYAEGSRALLVVLQGMDTSGKDGVTKSVFMRTSPLGVRVTAFGRPSEAELARDYLWRVHNAVPEKGHIGVFNRSHYEDVLVVKVRKLKDEAEIERRYDQINRFEQHLVENGVRILKLMLHISRDEQGQRLQERLDVPKKRWKFNPGDLEDRRLWVDFQAAYETMLRRCSTTHAPWHVVPADSKTRRDAIAARLVRQALEAMAPRYPAPDWSAADFSVD